MPESTSNVKHSRCMTGRLCYVRAERGIRVQMPLPRNAAVAARQSLIACWSLTTRPSASTGGPGSETADEVVRLHKRAETEAVPRKPCRMIVKARSDYDRQAGV